MYIKDLSQDPVVFVIEHENELLTELSSWHKKTLRLLLSNHDSQVSGNKETLLQNILAEVKLGTITLGTLQEWSNRYLEEGKRHLFIFEIIQEQVVALKNIEYFSSLIKEHNIEKTDLRNQKVNDGLIFFNYTILDEEVSNIKLVYKQRMTIRVPNYDTDRIDKNEIDYHIFITLDLNDSVVIINLLPLSGSIDKNESDAAVSVKKIALSYLEDLKIIFGLVFKDTFEVTQKALYRIWKDATKHDLPEIQDTLDNITGEVNSFVEIISKDDKLGLSKDVQTKLITKILSNIENVLITEKYDELKVEIEKARTTKPGYITEHNIRERTGSTLKQKSRDKRTPIEESDTFGDTRVTIDQLERVQKLTYTWNGIEDIPPGEIPTIIESFRMYDEIIFTSHTTLEEMDHVLYQLKRYKEKIRASRPSNS